MNGKPRKNAGRAIAELSVVSFPTAESFDQWLEANHARTEGIWLKFAKKASGVRSVTYPEAVGVALCHGWIDGQLKPLDERFYLQRFSPRRAKSIWSKRNVERVVKLIEAGRMRPAGLAQVEAAKKDGRWERAYDSPSTSVVPDDFRAALEKNAKARRFFSTLNRGNVYAMLFRIQTAKKPATRAAQIEKFIRMLNEGQTIHPMLGAKKESPGRAPGRKRPQRSKPEPSDH